MCAIVEVEKPDIICIVETWLSSEIEDNEVMIDNYQIIRQDRNRHGGGVFMYINSCLSVKVLSSGANSLELLIVSVSYVCNHFKYCISVFYRPPSSCIDIFDNLCTVLQNLHPSVFNNFVLIGDFNVNYFCTQSYLYKYLMNSFIPFSLH